MPAVSGVCGFDGFESSSLQAAKIIKREKTNSDLKIIFFFIINFLFIWKVEKISAKI